MQFNFYKLWTIIHIPPKVLGDFLDITVDIISHHQPTNGPQFLLVGYAHFSKSPPMRKALHS